MVWLTLVLGLGVVWLGQAGQGYSTAVYEGQIKSVKIDKCGLQPGLCEGSIILARQGGEAARVDVRVGTWIKRGDTFLTIEDLKAWRPGESPNLPLAGRSEPACGHTGVYPSVRQCSHVLKACPLLPGVPSSERSSPMRGRIPAEPPEQPITLDNSPLA